VRGLTSSAVSDGRPQAGADVADDCERDVLQPWNVAEPFERLCNTGERTAVSGGKMVHVWCRAFAAEVDFAVDYQPWVVASFSGIL
jgi:hypothetical protein